MKKLVFYVSLIAILVGLSGCSRSVTNMQIAKVDISTQKPKKGKAKVVFMRPSSMGYAIQSSLFEIKNNSPHVLGIIAAKKKVSYNFNPGEHLFMIIGESADFMTANLEADQVYYALITPRMGLWKARFSLKPITGEELNSSDFQEWEKDCQYIESNEATKAWAMANQNSIYSKYTEYYKDWLQKEEAERPKLLKTDFKK
jgi:hypothetical protein